MRSSEDNDDLEQVIVMARIVDPVDRKGGMRLNAAMKAEVVEKAMKHGFDKRKEALLKEELQLSRLFYLEAFGLAVLKHARALADTPFVYIGRDRYGRKLNKTDQNIVRWNIGGQTVDAHVDNNYPIPPNSDTTKFVIRQDKSPALVERCRAWQADVEKFNKEYQQTSATLKGMLERITTFPSLEKNWAAGQRFYKHLPTAYPFRHQVPAVMIDQLNASLGL